MKVECPECDFHGVLLLRARPRDMIWDGDVTWNVHSIECPECGYEGEPQTTDRGGRTRLRDLIPWDTE